MKNDIVRRTLYTVLGGTALLTAALPTATIAAESPFAVTMDKMEIDGLNIAYREAGDPENPTVLLLHGFPTSSHMFRELIPELAQDYHVIAPIIPALALLTCRTRPAMNTASQMPPMLSPS